MCMMLIVYCIGGKQLKCSLERMAPIPCPGYIVGGVSGNSPTTVVTMTVGMATLL